MRKYCLYFEMAKLERENRKNEEVKEFGRIDYRYEMKKIHNSKNEFARLANSDVVMEEFFFDFGRDT
jgi:hypothetical protein